MYVRRLRAGGAGIGEEFLALVRAALAHYGIASLEHSDALERAVLRLLASQHSSSVRHQLAIGGAPLRDGARAVAASQLAGDATLEDALSRIAGMRGLVPDAVADAAVDCTYEIFERPGIESLAERTSVRLEAWLVAAESEPTEPPEDVLLHLADAPRGVFDRVGRWLGHGDPRRRAIAVAAYLRRLYSPEAPLRHVSSLRGDGWYDRFEFAGGRSVLAATCAPEALVERAVRLARIGVEGAHGAGWPPVHAIELFVPVDDSTELDALLKPLESAMGAQGAPLAPHPERRAARRRPRAPHLRVLGPGPARRARRSRRPSRDGAPHRPRPPRPLRARAHPGERRHLLLLRPQPRGASDERIFVLADARSRSPEDGRDATLHLPAFEHAFYEATPRAAHDPRRTRSEAPAAVEPHHALRGARHLSGARRGPAARAAARPRDPPPRPREGRRAPDAARPRGAGARAAQRRVRDLGPHRQQHGDPSARAAHEPLEPSSAYERKVVEARRRGWCIPTRSSACSPEAPTGPASARAARCPPASSRSSTSSPARRGPSRAASPAGAYGANTSGGRLRPHPHADRRRCPRACRACSCSRDPTLGMGSLAAPECDRLVAALDLAERLRRARSSGSPSRAARASPWTAAPRTSMRPRASCGASSSSRRRAA